MVLRLCIVVPVYNEEAIVRESVETILSYARQLPCQATLLAVEDGSSDASAAVLAELAAGLPAREFQVVSHGHNRGYGAAQRTGAAFAVSKGFDYAVFMDSDLTDHPRYLAQICAAAGRGYDYIKTTRFTAGGGYTGVPWHRRLVACAANAFARLVTGLPLTDMSNGFRCVKVSLLAQMDLREDRFALIMEELMQARRLGARFCEVARVQGTRSSRARPSAFRYDWKTYCSYLRYLMRRSQNERKP